MKFMIAVLTLSSVSAFAQEQQTENSRSELSWVCSASGLDWQNTYRSVFGTSRPTEDEARRSALSECSAMGYMDCHVGACTQMN